MRKGIEADFATHPDRESQEKIMRNLHQHKFLRCALAVTLACGLSVPTTAISAYADGENTSTPPPSLLR